MFGGHTRENRFWYDKKEHVPYLLNNVTPLIQLDWPGIAEWIYADMFAVAVRFQNQDQFWVYHKTSGTVFYFFEKSTNELIQPKNDVFGDFSENLIVLQ